MNTEPIPIWKRIKKHATSIAFILGFVWDNIMLTRVDHAFVNIMLGFYLCLSAICILVMNMPTGESWHRRILDRSAKWLPLILQFCFGSLFSAYLILYTRSASLSTNWPFLLFLIALVISNELFRKKYLSITLPLSIFFTVLFSYSIFSLPVLVGSMGSGIFIASGIISLLTVYIMAKLLSRIAKEKFQSSGRSLIISILFIYGLFNFAYFTNIIPPVPLALKEIGVYHSISRFSDGTYSVIGEYKPWYLFFLKEGSVFHRTINQPVYVWSKVFAPTKLTVPIFHRWQYFDKSDETWVSTDLVQFQIVGGRDGGYRGYSVKSGVFPANWRVDVETLGKKLIGRIEFTIENVSILSSSLLTEKR